MKNKKILLCTNGNCGGAERMTLLYAKILLNAGFDIVLLVYLPDASQMDFPLKHFIPSELNVEYVHGRFRTFPFMLLRKIREINPDVFFSSSSHSAQFAILFRVLHLINARVIVRENTSPTRKSRLRCQLSGLLYPHSSKVIAQTTEMKAEMIKYYGLNENKIMVINNPLDEEQIISKSREIYPFDKDYTNYVAVGRLSTPKDYPTLLKAFSIVHKRNKQTRLYIVGSFENKKIKTELDLIVTENNLNNSVFFEGFQANPYKYMKWCDVFCLSSSIEGLPNVILEALFLGRPVAATKCIPFISHVIRDGENGFTCNVKDYVSFALCMEKSVQLVGKNIEYVSKTESEIIKAFK